MMRTAILQNISNPAALEKLYQSNQSGFKQAFNALYPLYKENLYLQAWNERINYTEAKTSIFNKKEIMVVLVLCFIAGLFANIANFSWIQPQTFFKINIALLIIPFISAYLIWRQNVSTKISAILLAIFVIAATYVNLLPNDAQNSTINLVNIHLPLFLWTVMGYAYLGNEPFNNQKRISYLKYNGDLLIMIAIIGLACIVCTAITFSLFELIGMKIEAFYMRHIAIWGIAGIPLLANYLIENNPQIINKVSPIIAKIFTPIAFVNLLIYLSALIYTGKYPHHDRNLLLIYNALLVGVLALIFFSIAESENDQQHFLSNYLLLGLSLLTIIINGIAVWAICFRIIEWGITPNRIAVLGGNIIIFINLIMVCFQLYKTIIKATNRTNVGNAIAKYLPVYAIWTAIVVFILPLAFHWK